MILTLLVLMNLVRTEPLVVSTELTQRAQARAELLCERQQWSHNGWTDSFEGLSYQMAGENLAKGFQSDVDAFNGLMASPTHRENILRHEYKEVGIGQACDIEVVLFRG